MTARRTLLRTLLSAGLAASLFGADVVLLTLHLNPGISLFTEAPALLASLFLPYAVAALPVLLLAALLGTALQWWPAGARSPIASMPWFTSLSALSVGASAALFGLNLWQYRYSIPVESVRALAGASLALAAAALVLLAVGLDALLFPLRDKGVSAAVAVLAAASAVVVPLAMLPEPAAPREPVPFSTESFGSGGRRLILVGIDGLSPKQLETGVAEGSLPAFARILRRGAHGPLATLRPTEGPPIWTTIFTGRFPRDHGVKSFVTYRLLGSSASFELLPTGALVGLLERAGFVSTSPVTAASRRCPTLWNALNAFGIQTGVVRIWGTYPVEKIQGFMLSHYFNALRSQPGRVAETLYPPDLLAEVEARAVDPADVDERLLSEFVDLSGDLPHDTVPWRHELVDRALAPDLTFERAGDVLRSAYDPPFFATYFYGLDVVGHTFTRFAEPERFGDVSTEQVRRYGRVVDRYAAFVGRYVGGLAQHLRRGEVLLVVSGYGMQPVPLWRRLLQGALGDSSMTATHADAPDGVFLAVGDGIRPGAVSRHASVLDLAPTILYLMGLPVGRDMEGRVLTEILDESFARQHPVTYIPSYESLAVTSFAGRPESSLPPLPDEEP